jgi:hypothetical protein
MISTMQCGFVLFFCRLPASYSRSPLRKCTQPYRYTISCTKVLTFPRDSRTCFPTLSSIGAPRFEAAETALFQTMTQVPLFSPIGESDTTRTPTREDSKSFLDELCQHPPVCRDKMRLGDCELFPRSEDVYELSNVALVWLFRALFVTAATLCEASVDRFDLHHAHWWHNSCSRQFGFLWHAREYPARNQSLFPHDLGYCQKGSSLHLHSDRDMLRRNVLWVAGNPEMHLLNPVPLVDEEHMTGIWTVDEAVFGRRIADVYYFGRERNFALQNDVFLVPFL